MNLISVRSPESIEGQHTHQPTHTTTVNTLISILRQCLADGLSCLFVDRLVARRRSAAAADTVRPENRACVGRTTHNTQIGSCARVIVEVGIEDP